MIAAVGRAIRRACSAGAGRLRSTRTRRFAPGRVGNARAVHRATAENLLALLEAVIGAVDGAGWTLQAERLLFTLRVRHLLRDSDQRTGHGNRQKHASAHENRSCIVRTVCPGFRRTQFELIAARSTLQTTLATNCSVKATSLGARSNERCAFSIQGEVGLLRRLAAQHAIPPGADAGREFVIALDHVDRLA